MELSPFEAHQQWHCGGGWNAKRRTEPGCHATGLQLRVPFCSGLDVYIYVCARPCNLPYSSTGLQGWSMHVAAGCTVVESLCDRWVHNHLWGTWLACLYSNGWSFLHLMWHTMLLSACAYIASSPVHILGQAGPCLRCLCNSVRSPPMPPCQEGNGVSFFVLFGCVCCRASCLQPVMTQCLSGLLWW